MARNKTYIDPAFYRPEEVTDFTASDPDNIKSPVKIPSGSYAKQVSTTVDTTAEPVVVSQDSLPAPQNMTIVSQTVRTKPDGTHVVDLVVEVDDIIGAQTYDIRVTRA